MTTVTARDARRKPPAPPRPPRSWSLDPATPELTITDCNGAAETCHVRRIPAAFGAAWELTNVGARFGAFHHVHLDGPDASCTCPGGSYRGACKHVTALAALREGGAL